MKRVVLVFLACTLLSGCFQYYAYQGKVYGLTMDGAFGVFRPDGTFQHLEKGKLFDDVMREGWSERTFVDAMGSAEKQQAKLRTSGITQQSSASGSQKPVQPISDSYRADASVWYKKDDTGSTSSKKEDKEDSRGD